MLIIDGHLDLAMNALDWNRDLTRPVAELRRSERWMNEKGRAACTVAFPELKKGRVMIGFATLLSRLAHETNRYQGENSQAICHAKAMGHLAYYELCERQGEAAILKDWADVEGHVSRWKTAAPGDEPPLGVVISMEGADPITSPDELPLWWERGLRLLGLAHYGAAVTRTAPGRRAA